MRSFESVSSQGTDLEVDHLIKYPFEDILALFLESSGKYALPLAAWRLPNQSTRHMILDLSGEVKQVEIDLEHLSPGFIFSPFDQDFSDTNARANYINADLHFNTHTHQIKLNKSNEASGAINAYELKKEIIERLEKGYSRDELQVHGIVENSDIKQLDKAHFSRLVSLAVDQIKAGAFKKVVPSRCELIPLHEGFNLPDTFEKMCKMYPQAFISLLAVPGLGIWLGASPEILVRTFLHNESRFFRTIALAGTQKLDEVAGIRNATWRIKEIEEQAMVSRYIINCFKKIRLREFDEDGPKTVAAGNLLHLRTDFTVNMDQVNFPELGSVMLKLLHPTSAVCGLPKESSLLFLKDNEAYERGLFAGFLGPVNMEDQINIFVNLRCMQLTKEGALLYAGAGVTADSDPEKEWQETAMKMQTLQKAITK